MVETPDQEDEVSFILSLTTEQVKSTAVNLGHGTACPTCSAARWSLATFENKPTILTLPIINTEELAAWFYNMQCLQCGLSKLISVSVIVDTLKKMEAANGR